MHIVSVSGGLGNQMFQYAFYLSLKSENKYVFYWVAPYERHNGFELDIVFGIKQKLYCNYFLKIFKFSTKYLGERNTDINWGNFCAKQYHSTLIYHSGYWQSEKYFYNIQNLIRETFSFKTNKLNIKSKDLLHKIRSVVSVSLHIRRGDYLSDMGAKELLGNICTSTYYLKAINNIRMSIIDPVSFFVFSDDIDWAMDTFKIFDFNYINWNINEESWMDMCLMSNCKHNIIANSSFSWWGAWLNKNPNKIVITPTKWFNHHEALDIIPDKWIKISV